MIANTTFRLALQEEGRQPDLHNSARNTFVKDVEKENGTRVGHSIVSGNLNKDLAIYLLGDDKLIRETLKQDDNEYGNEVQII